MDKSGVFIHNEMTAKIAAGTIKEFAFPNRILTKEVSFEISDLGKAKKPSLSLTQLQLLC